MGRIDHRADVVITQVSRHPLGPAEAADPGGQGLGDGRLGPSGIGEDRRDTGAGQKGGQAAGLTRAAQQQDASHV